MSSGIRSRNGRHGFTTVPNWRWEDTDLNPYDLRVAGWLASHADRWRSECVSRNMIAARTGIAASTVSKSLARLVEREIIIINEGKRHRFVIEFDFEVWDAKDPLVATRPVATRPVSGRVTPSDRSSDDHIEEQREEQQKTPLTPQGGRERKPSAPPEPLTVSERCEDFGVWWEAWPKKVGEFDAVKSWRIMLEYLPSVETLLHASAAIEEQARLDHVGDADWLRWIPHPSKWLRRGDYLAFVDGAPVTVKPRNPCVLCGVTQPSMERCEGVAVGHIESTAECIWRDTV